MIRWSDESIFSGNTREQRSCKKNPAQDETHLLKPGDYETCLTSNKYFLRPRKMDDFCNLSELVIFTYELTDSKHTGM